MARQIGLGLVLFACSACWGQDDPLSGAPGTPALDWRTLEAPALTSHVQLTGRDEFLKAGEAYFSPDMQWIIFQAIAVPPEGSTPEPYYSMYVARLTRDSEGWISGIEKSIRVSNDGSANTCGWFHPTQPGTVLFGSTINRPTQKEKPGFSGPSGRYVWAFPEETEIVVKTLPEIGGSARNERVLFKRDDYDAEGSWSRDGRHVIHARVVGRDGGTGRVDADIWVYDTKAGAGVPLVEAPGYDGGPFFSPDEKWICYRSDRKGDDRLQLYIAELARDESGAITGIQREYQITDNEHVNWAPYWHPDGDFLVYATSQMGHWNYEVFAVELDFAQIRSGRDPHENRQVRMTFANGADVLPAFSPDGKYMMWCGQRGELAPGEQRPSSQLWIARLNPSLSRSTVFRTVGANSAEIVARAAADAKVAWAADAVPTSKWDGLNWIVTLTKPDASAKIDVVVEASGRVLHVGSAH